MRKSSAMFASVETGNHPPLLLMSCGYHTSRAKVGDDFRQSPKPNFHEKALFVKADVVASLAVERNGSVSFAMLPSALSLGPHSSVARCDKTCASPKVR